MDIKQRLNNNKLPVSFLPVDYGKIISRNGDNYFVVKISAKSFAIINQFNDDNGKYNIV